ncbi:MAG: carbohydrate binding domain-containing protein [Prosthecobacter sp.]|uniref:carbohydrate binding domain-containing protein n=1 Tax=Prosthecobacter sp. TaxID=1965333 RepID=UPI003BAEB248
MVRFIILTLVSSSLALNAAEPKGGRPNLLENAAFESAMTGWTVTSHENLGKVDLDKDVKRGETPSLRITNPGASDTFCKQIVKVKPGMRYRFTGYIKTKDVVVKGGQAANLSLDGTYERSPSLKGSESWRKVEFEFDSGPSDTVQVGCRLGGWFSMTTGTAWFDDLKLIEIGKSRKG